MSSKIINSPNFKKWFGDWENNPESASKVVDDNGLPLVVYHGTDAEFNEFNSKFIGQSGTQHGQGFYFTSNKEFAGNFGKNIKSFYLNIRKPLSSEELTLSYEDCVKLMDAIDKKQCEADPDFGYGILSDYGDVDSEGRENVLKSAADLEYSSSDNDVELVGSLINASGDYGIVTDTLYSMFGYDGIMCPEKEIYIVHHANQIKEINNVTFNQDSNNVYESKKHKRIFVTENQYRQLINESQESKSIDAAKKLLMSNGYTPEQADKFVRIDLRNDIPILRTPKGGKFILGCTRMFLNRELNSADVILNLDKTLKLLISAHYNEYDRNLNNLSAEELVNRFADARSEDSANRRKELEGFRGGNSNYEIVPINSFGEASEYSDYTSWCVTHDENMFDSYTADGEAQFYFCLRNGFENVAETVGQNAPLDEYGLSMIAVCVDGEGDLKTCTCRWNHDNGGNDSILNEKQISEIVGVNFYEVFKPNNVLASKIEALKTMTEIPNNYFRESKIKKIVIPNNITSIGEQAFYYCDSLTSVTIPYGITEIGYYTFFHCTSLTSVTIPDSVTSIGMEAFRGCTSLTSVTIPNSVTSIGQSAFSYCGSLKKVIAPIRFAEQFKKYYNIDIIPSDRGGIHESMNRKSKRIFISESQLEMIKQHINENSETYYVDTQKVLIVKKYLDSAFSRGKMNGMSPNGYPTKTNVIGMKGNDGEVIRNMSFEQALDLLEDKFHNIYTNEDKRTKFLKAVLNDWYNKKITKEGMLSKNSF